MSADDERHHPPTEPAPPPDAVGVATPPRTRPGFFLTPPPDIDGVPEPLTGPLPRLDSTLAAFEESALDDAARAALAEAGAPTPATPPRAQRPPDHEETKGTWMTRAYDGTPMLEVEVVHRHGPAPRMDRRAPIVEVWTQRHVYTVDAAMVCTGVAEIESGAPVAGHAFIGQRLVGGQHRDGETFQLSYPFPRPGTEAVFEKGDAKQAAFSHTSTVTRVVLRLHVVTVAPTVVTPTWHSISQRELMGGVPLPAGLASSLASSTASASSGAVSDEDEVAPSASPASDTEPTVTPAQPSDAGERTLEDD